MNTALLNAIDAKTYADPDAVITELVALANLSPEDRTQITDKAAALVTRIRTGSEPGLMEVFLAEYGLSTDEGIALMCLAEALLRVPDADTIDALIEDKIAPSDWGKHLGQSASSLVNASTWALMLTGRVLDDDAPGPARHLQAALKRVGEPVIRAAVSRAMKEMGRQFVLGEDINAAMKRAAGMEAKGFTYSYDMLGEAARTEGDARRYHLSYSRAISAIATACTHNDVRENPGISVKLSALYPRYELAKHADVLRDLTPRLRSLALLAKSAGMGLNVDAEEANRLALSLDVIENVLSEPALAGWDGFGVVVQAYGPRAGTVIDTLYDMASKLDRKIMVRLVKGAYWDTEVKLAQTLGMDAFPVFTQKAQTDVSYIANARRLLGMTDRIYPQFATHNAHTVSAILHMADDVPYEFQRLHGMGEAMHLMVMQDNKTRCRIYAPVGAHRDLLAYLVRRLLENGANSSFVNQIVDEDVAPETVTADPFEALNTAAPDIATGTELYLPERPNSKGFDLGHAPTLDRINADRTPFATHQWHAKPQLAAQANPAPETPCLAPSDPSDTVGHVQNASLADVETAVQHVAPWNAPLETRRHVLNAAADLYEQNYGELFALLTREAGKTLLDCVAELREAIDFLRYYAAQATDDAPAGTALCISPWNFPLAIYTGQMAAALAQGNAVLSKPAAQTPLMAYRAAELLHAAGVPLHALQVLPGGADIGAALTAHPDLNVVAFTGSTATALKIRQSLADNAPATPLIAETGGLNAMIVDSTALPEQAVASIIESAFQSAGQRCSALRCLYVQEDIAPHFTEMLMGAMDSLSTGNPWDLQSDLGPVIDAQARDKIAAHIAASDVIHQLPSPNTGTFIAPTLLRVAGIADMQEEIFGPVLHLATFKSHELDAIIDDINATGYGLTFGLHTRIDDRVQHVSDRIKAGNIYVNRNQIGAIVGSQPFGGNGLSGTGPKAGGPDYLLRFRAPIPAHSDSTFQNKQSELPTASVVETLIHEASLPGPTGESNRLSAYDRGPVLCMGPGDDAAAAQAQAITALGGTAVAATGQIAPHQLTDGPAYAGVIWWGDADAAQAIDKALAQRSGAIVPLITHHPDAGHAQSETHICIDTTASGGNAALLGEVGQIT
ncbi:bifunctional proline dehydrogenase/L-glutamate gamma-semialdehyde dehydrogenase PutA [Ascidiaceihabitans sp.]|uniref:bifunctional proline dehydrogenase/L-glutamate gamma-semialdehyde dehydrogenase PutA n=1 Tax=Ascidiaceihabitans sp. TaxID=1872644 RepID=UPI003299080A